MDMDNDWYEDKHTYYKNELTKLPVMEARHHPGDWIVESQFDRPAIASDWYRGSPPLDLDSACARMAQRRDKDAHTYFDPDRISYRLRNVKTGEIIPGEIFG